MGKISQKIAATLRGRRALLAAVAATIGMAGNSTNAGLTHRYSFNDDTANDSVGGANGTLVNQNGNGSISGGQVNFGNSGTSNDVLANNYVDLPNNIAKTANFTVEGWATWGGGGDWQRLFDFGTNTSGEELPGATTTGYTGTNYFLLTPRSGNDAGNGRLNNYNGEINQNGSAFVNARNASNQAFDFGANSGEHMFALTYDSTAKTLSMYYDGSLVGQTANVTKDITSIDQVNMWLGRSNWQGDPFYNGSINEFRIYDNALTAGQIGADAGFGPDSLGASGTNVWQTAGTGNFSNSPSWSLAHVPTSTEKATIPNGATVNVNSDVGTNAVVQITNGTLAFAAGGALVSNIDLAPASGPGTATLNLNGGTLSVGQITVDNGTTGGTAAKAVNFNGGTLVSTRSFTLAGTNLTSSVGAAGATFDTQNNSVVTWGTALTPTAAGASLFKQGNGSLILQSGGFVGNVQVRGGLLSAAGNLGTASATLQLGDTNFGGGDNATLAFSAPATLLSALTVGSAGSGGVYALNVSANAAVSIPRQVLLNQPLTINTAATTGTNGLAFTGGIKANNAGEQTLTFNNAGTVTVSTAGISDGNGGTISIIKNNGGVTFFNAANTYSGNTTINGGGILFAAPNTIGGTGQSVLVNSGGVAAAGPTYTNLMTTFFNRIDPNSAGVLAITANSAENIDFSALGFGAASFGAGTNVTYTGIFTPANNTYMLGGGGGTLTLPNTNAITGSASLIAGGAGGGAVVLGSTNDFTGSVTIRNNTALSISNPASIGTGQDPISFNGGILQITGTTPFTLSRPLTIGLGGGTVRVDNAAGATLTGGFTNANAGGNNAFFKTGLGNLTLTGNNDNGSNSIFVNQGTLTVGQDTTVTSSNYNSIGQINNDNGTLVLQNNAQYTVNGDFNIGDVNFAKGTLVIKDTAQVNATTFYVGKFNSTQGVGVQTGGSISSLTGNGDWRIGGGGGTADAASVGTYDLSAGTFSTTGNFQIGAFGTGGMTITGTGAASSGTFPVVGRFAGGFGVLTVNGGSFSQLGAGQFMIVGEQGYGILNVGGNGAGSGGLVDITGARLRIGHTNSGTGVVNLGSGGTIAAATVDTAAGSVGTLNFHGGTLQAKAASATFVSTTSALVWPEGGTIDSNGNDLAIAQALAAPTGSGVTSIAVANAGTAYVGTPVVRITGGGGSGASAIPILSNGTLTGFKVTNPGTGYTSAPTVQILGGGGTNAAAGAVAIGANASGGITKIGSGVLTLSAANTYTGDTIVNGGAVKVTGSLAGGVVVNTTGTFDAAAPQTVKTLTVNAGGLTTVSGGTLKVGNNATATPLITAGNGRVDLMSNALVVDHGAGNDTASLKSVRQQIVSGFHGGDWAGPGIASSTITGGRGIGYALASEVLPFANGATTDTFRGATVDKTSVVARTTLLGDATVDGTVDFNDLVKLAQNYNTTVSTTTESWWTHGDFTYDGITDFNDLVKLAQNYNTSLPAAGSIPGASAVFEADMARAFASVPEPSALALAAIAGCALAAKRRRRRKA